MSGGRKRWWLPLGGAFLVAATAWGQALRDLPPIMRTVSDEVGALTDDEGKVLSSALQHILDEDGIRVVLVIAETTRPEPIKDYADRLSRRWAQDRGIDPARAIFMVVSVNDREMMVLPGRNLGLEVALADPALGQGLPPLFRERRYYDALMTLTNRVHHLIHGEPPIDSPR